MQWGFGRSMGNSTIPDQTVSTVFTSSKAALQSFPALEMLGIEPEVETEPFSSALSRSDGPPPLDISCCLTNY